MKNKCLPYKLIGDAAYPLRPWFFSPFKGIKDSLPYEKNHWKFIKSCIGMAGEWAFGCLIGRWRIILKRIDVPFQIFYDLLTTYICLHNLCIIHSDRFNMRWVTEAKKNIRDSISLQFGNLPQTTHDAITFQIANE